MKRDPLFFRGNRQEYHQFGGAIIELIHGNNQTRANARLFVAPRRVQINKPDFATLNLRHWSVVFLAVAKTIIP